MGVTRGFLNQWGVVDSLQRAAYKVCRSSAVKSLPVLSMLFVIASGPGDFTFFNISIAVITSRREMETLIGGKGFVDMLCAALASRWCSFTFMS